MNSLVLKVLLAMAILGGVGASVIAITYALRRSRAAKDAKAAPPPQDTTLDAVTDGDPVVAQDLAEDGVVAEDFAEDNTMAGSTSADHTATVPAPMDEPEAVLAEADESERDAGTALGTAVLTPAPTAESRWSVFQSRGGLMA